MAPRPGVALALVALLALTAGCQSVGPLAESSAETTPTVTPTEVPTDEAVASTETPTATATAFDWRAASNEPDPSKHVHVENQWNETVTLNLRVVRNATDEVVHEARYELAPDEQRTAYDTSAADPDGVEQFTAIATARNRTANVSIETNQCYGSAHAIVTDEGEVETFYSIC